MLGAGLLLLSLAQASANQERLYVSNEESGDVSVIDPESGKVIQTIPVGKRPRGIQASSDGTRVYVALSGSPSAGPGVDVSSLPPPDHNLDGIGVILAQQGQIEKRLDGGTDPEQFAVTGQGPSERLYIANEDRAALSVLDPRTGKSHRIERVGREPEGVAVSPDGLFAYVTSEADQQVSVIDTQKNQIKTRIKVGLRPRAIAFLPDGSRAYVTCEASGELAVIDARRHRLLKKIPLREQDPAILPMGIVLDPSLKRAYVSGGRSGKLVQIDLSTDRVMATLEVGKRPWGIQISPDGTRVYTANGPSNDVTVVSTSRFQILRKIEVGKKPWGIARIQ